MLIFLKEENGDFYPKDCWMPDILYPDLKLKVNIYGPSMRHYRVGDLVRSTYLASCDIIKSVVPYK